MIAAISSSEGISLTRTQTEQPKPRRDIFVHPERWGTVYGSLPVHKWRLGDEKLKVRFASQRSDHAHSDAKFPKSTVFIDLAVSIYVLISMFSILCNQFIEFCVINCDASQGRDQLATRVRVEISLRRTSQGRDQLATRARVEISLRRESG